MPSTDIPSILLIENSQTLRKRIITMLALRGIRVIFADDQNDVLQQAIEHNINLIIINPHANTIDGLDFITKCRQLKRLTNVPIVLITTAADAQAHNQEWTDAGANQCLIMPLNETSFINSIFKYIQPSSISIAH
jgi:CheY-like chemotaxis protein